MELYILGRDHRGLVAENDEGGPRHYRTDCCFATVKLMRSVEGPNESGITRYELGCNCCYQAVNPELVRVPRMLLREYYGLNRRGLRIADYLLLHAESPPKPKKPPRWDDVVESQSWLDRRTSGEGLFPRRGRRPC